MLKLRAILLAFIIFISSKVLAVDAEIYSAKSAIEINNSLMEMLSKRNPQKTLLLLPLEAVIEFVDPALRTKDESLQKVAIRMFKKAKHSRKSYLGELILTEYENKLSDPDWANLVQNVQKMQAPFIITTSNVSGSFNNISHLEVWTWSYLKKLGIDLSNNRFNDDQFMLNKHNTKFKGTYPTFYRGLLSCNSGGGKNTRQTVLSGLLVRYVKWLPDVVYIIDKDEKYIESLIRRFKILNNDTQVVGFVYDPEYVEDENLEVKSFAKTWKKLVNKLNKISRSTNNNKENPYEQ